MYATFCIRPKPAPIATVELTSSNVDSALTKLHKEEGSNKHSPAVHTAHEEDEVEEDDVSHDEAELEPAEEHEDHEAEEEAPHEEEAEEDEHPAAKSVSQTASKKHYTGSKEKFGKGKVDYGAILSQLYVPKEPGWEAAKINRLVVNQQNPENKYDSKTKGAQDWMPKHDLDVQYKTCAVVGNGGALTKNKYGKAIDEHDAVFRFNDGPTAGFEDVVGTKTTYRMINNAWSRTWLKKRPKGTSEEALLLFGQGAAKSTGALAHKWQPNTKVYFMAPEFAGNARGMYKKAYVLMADMGFIEVKGRNSPPTGIEGLFFARALCDKVHIYGFNVVRGMDVPYHYHDKVVGAEDAHSFNFQGIFIQMLVNAGYFEMCVPTLAVDECDMGHDTSL